MLTEAQQKIRAGGIGGSEIAAVAGLNPWRSPFDVYCSKKGLVNEADTHHIQRGTYLEPALRHWYAAKTGRLVDTCSTIVHHEHPIVIATPDGISRAAHDVRVLEIKSPGWRTQSHWGESGTDSVPEYYIPQLMWECAVVGVQSADVAAFIDGDLRVYNVPFDLPLFDALRDIAEKFWCDHILADVPPPPDGSDKAREWLVARYPRAVSSAIDATEAMIEHARAYVQARDQESVAKRAKENAGNNLRALLGDHQGAKGGGVAISYTNNKDTISVNWQAVAQELQAPQEIIQKHTTTTPGARVLRVTLKDA